MKRERERKSFDVSVKRVHLEIYKICEFSSIKLYLCDKIKTNLNRF